MSDFGRLEGSRFSISFLVQMMRLRMMMRVTAAGALAQVYEWKKLTLFLSCS